MSDREGAARAGGDAAGADEAAGRLLIDSPYICQCHRIDEARLAEIADEARTLDYDVLREFYGVGARCTSCEIDVRDFLHEMSQGRADEAEQGPPLLLRAKRAVREARSEARFLARSILRWPRRFALFVVRTEEIESELVLSNLTFPDDERNANGDEVRFDTLLYDASGHLVARKDGWTLGANHSRAWSLDELADGLPSEFTGSVHVHFYSLRETGSLRPYCRLKYDRDGDDYLGATHYHDQYVARKHYQHVMVTHPQVPDQRCWVALSNPVDEPFSSRAILSIGEDRHIATVEIEPFGSLFRSIPELFPSAPAETEEPSHFWLESDDTVMAWFFWERPTEASWIAQHK